MTGLSPGIGLVIGFGAVHMGYEWIGRGETDGRGAFTAAARVPDWADPNEVHYFFLTLPDRPPLGTSPGFHVTAADGSLRVTGVVTEDGAGHGFTALRGPFDELYCLSRVPAGARPGARITVVGELGDPRLCADGIPVEVRGENRPGLAALWASDRAAFGIFVPDRTETGGETLARNPLYDFLFLDLERGYDANAVGAVATGVNRAAEPVPAALLVRIPPLSSAGEAAVRSWIRETLALGANGIVLPHVRSPDEARLAVRLVAGTGANVWSPRNPTGDVVLMLMLEDPESVARAREFAEVPGYSILACGIGSLASALGGDRDAAEAGAQRVLEEARRAGLPDMITANASSIAGRVEQGFLALLLSGPGADEAIRIGRRAAGRG